MLLIQDLKSLTEEELATLVFIINIFGNPSRPFNEITAPWFRDDYIKAVLDYAGQRGTEEAREIIKNIKIKVIGE